LKPIRRPSSPENSDVGIASTGFGGVEREQSFMLAHF
jgi:hypothetical protein